MKMAAEIFVLNEIIDASITEELLLDNEEDGEFHLISATAAFLKRNLKRIVGFCEVVVPSYTIDEFRSLFRSSCSRVGSYRWNPHRKTELSAAAMLTHPT